jgi:hypothetical protein
LHGFRNNATALPHQITLSHTKKTPRFPDPTQERLAFEEYGREMMEFHRRLLEIVAPERMGFVNRVFQRIQTKGHIQRTKRCYSAWEFFGNLVPGELKDVRQWQDNDANADMLNKVLLLIREVDPEYAPGIHLAQVRAAAVEVAAEVPDRVGPEEQVGAVLPIPDEVEVDHVLNDQIQAELRIDAHTDPRRFQEAVDNATQGPITGTSTATTTAGGSQETFGQLKIRIRGIHLRPLNC